jgi:putative IMPACT (imprinted ancient) family translation regulator
VGGLIKAYRSAAADALEQATVIREKVFTRWQLNFGYPQMNAVMRLVKEFDLVMENQQFDMECQLVLAIWKRDEKRIMERIALIGDCRASALE